MTRKPALAKPPLLFEVFRELATLLRVKPRALFKSLGGYQEKKKHRIVLGGVPYAFPNLGNVIVPFQASIISILLSLRLLSTFPCLARCQQF